MLTIEEVEEIMSRYPLLPKPRYLYLVKTRVARFVNGLVEYKGATLVNPRDRICLTASADEATVAHELLHLAGFGELGASLLTLPLVVFRKVFPPIFRQKVKYELVDRPHQHVEVYAKV